MKGFPFNFKGELVFYHSGETDIIKAQSQIWENLQTKSVQQNTAPVHGGPFFIPSNLTIDVQTDAVVLHIQYAINLMSLNALAFIGFAMAFFAGFFGYFLSAYSIAALTTIGYFLVLVMQYGYIERKIANSLNLPPFEGEIALWHKQQQWLKQSSVCPACGEPRNMYSNKCIVCGLNLPAVGGQKPVDTNESLTSDVTIQYDYKRR